MKPVKKIADIIICGAGIIGLTICRELLDRGYDNIVILEKEDQPARHASGRNSGVLHSGIYYDPGSLRARSCLEGNRLMKEFCRTEGLPLNECGKVIVTRDENEEKNLKNLYDRARANGTPVELIDAHQLKGLEPAARTFNRALYSPETAVTDPAAVCRHLAEKLEKEKGVTICYNTPCTGFPRPREAATPGTTFQFKYFINAAGSFSDQIAHSRNLGTQYRLVPFKGTYFTLDERKKEMVRGNIYPVPDIRNPFLGVHFTRSIKGEVYIGPTAIPAFGRENYHIFDNIGTEAFSILLTDAVLFLKNKKFRKVALSEPLKYLKSRFYHDAAQLVKDLKKTDILSSPKRGIRPQLIDTDKKEMVMDFLLAEDNESLHILNAVSPAFTASMSFARMVADRVTERL